MKYISIKNKKFPIIDSPEYPYLNYNGYSSNLELANENNFSLKFNNKYFNIKDINIQNIAPVFRLIPDKEVGAFIDITNNIVNNEITNAPSVAPSTTYQIIDSNLNDFPTYMQTCSIRVDGGSGNYTYGIRDNAKYKYLNNIDITMPQIYSVAFFHDGKGKYKKDSEREFHCLFKYKENKYDSITIYLGGNSIFIDDYVAAFYDGYNTGYPVNLSQWSRLTTIFSPLGDYKYNLSFYVNGILIHGYDYDYNKSTTSHNLYGGIIHGGYPGNSTYGSLIQSFSDMEFLNTSADLTGTKYMRAPQ